MFIYKQKNKKIKPVQIKIKINYQRLNPDLKIHS